jgi:hypothetical protein
MRMLVYVGGKVVPGVSCECRVASHRAWGTVSACKGWGGEALVSCRSCLVCSFLALSAAAVVGGK